MRHPCRLAHRPFRRRPIPFGGCVAALALAAAATLVAANAPARADVEVDGVTVRVTKADCLRLVKHEPAPDVAYRPGTERDSDGELIVPPDLHGRPRLDLPDSVEVPIEVDLDERYGLPSDDSFKGDVQVGRVRIDLKSGRATFNGQPLTGPDEAELRAKCADLLDRPED